MLRSTAKSMQRWSKMLDSKAQISPRSAMGPRLAGVCSSVSSTPPSPICLPSFDAPPSIVVRSFHRTSLSEQQQFNLLPVYNMHATKLPTHRIGIRFMHSDSKKPPHETGETQVTPESSLETTPVSGQTTVRNLTAKERESATENVMIKGLKASVDTTLQEVRSKVDPRDLLYYFGILATFAVLVVGPFAARQMQLSDTDYDELDPEDPVADLATFVRAEFLKDMMGENYEEQGSKMGGLDTLLADLLRSPQIQNAVIDLVNSILTSPQFKRACSILLKELWKDLVEDPETLQQVIHLLQNAIQDEAIKDAAVQLVTEVFGDQEVLDEVVDLFQKLGRERKVQLATQELLVESAHNALNDPEILDHSMEFATDVVGDDVVQQTAGEALYNTLSYAVRPTLSIFLAVLGTGLILVSLMAFQHSISPESQSQSLDRALATFEKSQVVQRLIQMVTFPWYALIACKDALWWLLMLPFRAITGTLNGLGRAGNVTIDALNRCIHWFINLPILLAQSLESAIGRGLTGMSEGLANQSRQMGKALSGSSLAVFFYVLADGFSLGTTAMIVAWKRSNSVVGDGALALESCGRQLYQVLEKGVATSFAGWLTTKSTVVETTSAVRTQWIAINRTVATRALLLDCNLKHIWNLSLKSMERLQTRTADMGVTKESIRAVSIQGKDLVAAAYCRANDGATKIGFFLEGLLGKIYAKM